MCEKSLIKIAKFLSIIILFFAFNEALNAQVQANFTADTTIGCGSLTVKFTSSSSGNIANYNWDFGNGNSSTLQNPSAVYSSTGTFDVRLIVSNANGTEKDTLLKTNYISIKNPPDADFSFNPKGGCSPLSVSFTNSTTIGDAPIASNRWVFADGSQPYFGNNASHTYQTAGNFRPSLEVVDQNGCRDFAVKDTVFVTQAPQAQFSTSNSRISCQAPYTVNFKNNSSGFNLSYQWDFGNGSTSTQENPSHTYNNLGKYDVTLIVSDPNCSDTLVQSEYIILENSEANFSLAKDTLCAGEPFSPIDQSQGASIYSWNFGDGTTINSAQPTHSYQDSGTYVIRLTVSAGAACTDTYFDTVYVKTIKADFTTSSHYACNQNDSVQFFNTGSNASQLIWKIGTKDSSRRYTGDSIIHFQGGKGVYSDTLIAISNLGCADTLVIDSNREVDPVIAQLAMDGSIYAISIDPAKPLILGCLPEEKEFSDSSIGPGTINQWRWEYSVEDTSLGYRLIDSSDLQFPPPYTFETDSMYLVSLTVWNNLGCKSYDYGYFLGGFKQHPKITFFPDSVCQGDTLFIQDESTDTNKIDKYSYILISRRDDNPIAETSAALREDFYFHTYQDTGTHFINALVSYNGCDSSYTTSDSVFIKGPLSKVEYVSPGCKDFLTVEFKGNMKGATRFYWDFGDSTALDSVNENPTHVYAVAQPIRGVLTTFNDSNGCEPYKDTFYLNLGSPPPLTFEPDTQNFCLGDTATLSIPDYQYYIEGYWVLNGDTVASGKEHLFEFTEKGTYPIEIHTTHILGCTYSFYDTLYVSKPEANISSEILEACLPMDVIFKDASLSDTTIYSWIWTFGNGDTSYQAIDTTTYQNAGKMDVSLRVENIFGCADSVYLKNYLNTSNFSVNFTQSKVVICSGDSVTFRNQSTGNNIDYMWIFGEDTIMDNSKDITHTFTEADTFNIILIGSNQLGCSISEVKERTLVVGAQPQADFVADTLQSNCYPLDVNFTDLSSGNVNQWNWRFGDGNSSVLQNPFNSYISLGTFDVFLKVSNAAGCEDSTLKTQYIQTNGPAANIQLSTDSACIHEPVTFSLNNQQNVNDLQWDFGDGTISKNEVATHAFTRTGTVYFTLSLFDSLGFCQVTIRDSIHIFEVSADFTVDEDTACQPHRAVFTSLSPGASQFTWDFGDGNTSTDPITTNTYQSPGLFTAQLIVNSSLGCKDTAQHDILVHPKPQAESHKDTTICFGDTIELWAKGGTVYHWNNEQFLFDDSSSTTRAWPNTTTTFRIEVFNEFNCIDTAYILVKVQPPPLKNPLNYSDTSIIIGEYLDLDATAGDSLNYSWTPEKGLSCANCPNPRAQPLKNTTYVVTISDPYGCFSFKDTIFIEVIEEYTLEVPNAFSPNGDGNNDIIYAKGWGLKELIAFKIYNRYGELVFESNDFDKGWDGTYKGKPQNMETYVYTVEAETYSGEVLSKKGNISLLK